MEAIGRPFKLQLGEGTDALQGRLPQLPVGLTNTWQAPPPIGLYLVLPSSTNADRRIGLSDFEIYSSALPKVFLLVPKRHVLALAARSRKKVTAPTETRSARKTKSLVVSLLRLLLCLSRHTRAARHALFLWLFAFKMRMDGVHWQSSSTTTTVQNTSNRPAVRKVSDDYVEVLPARAQRHLKEADNDDWDAHLLPCAIGSNNNDLNNRGATGSAASWALQKAQETRERCIRTLQSMTPEQRRWVKPMAPKSVKDLMDMGPLDTYLSPLGLKLQSHRVLARAAELLDQEQAKAQAKTEEDRAFFASRRTQLEQQMRAPTLGPAEQWWLRSDLPTDTLLSRIANSVETKLDVSAGVRLLHEETPVDMVCSCGSATQPFSDLLLSCSCKAPSALEMVLKPDLSAVRGIETPLTTTAVDSLQREQWTWKNLSLLVDVFEEPALVASALTELGWEGQLPLIPADILSALLLRYRVYPGVAAALSQWLRNQDFLLTRGISLKQAALYGHAMFQLSCSGKLTLALVQAMAARVEDMGRCSPAWLAYAELTVAAFSQLQKNELLDGLQAWDCLRTALPPRLLLVAQLVRLVFERAVQQNNAQAAIALKRCRIAEQYSTTLSTLVASMANRAGLPICSTIEELSLHNSSSEPEIVQGLSSLISYSTQTLSQQHSLLALPSTSVLTLLDQGLLLPPVILRGMETIARHQLSPTTLLFQTHVQLTAVDLLRILEVERAVKLRAAAVTEWEDVTGRGLAHAAFGPRVTELPVSSSEAHYVLQSPPGACAVWQLQYWQLIMSAEAMVGGPRYYSLETPNQKKPVLTTSASTHSAKASSFYSLLLPLLHRDHVRESDDGKPIVELDVEPAKHTHVTWVFENGGFVKVEREVADIPQAPAPTDHIVESNVLVQEQPQGQNLLLHNDVQINARGSCFACHRVDLPSRGTWAQLLQPATRKLMQAYNVRSRPVGSALTTETLARTWASVDARLYSPFCESPTELAVAARFSAMSHVERLQLLLFPNAADAVQVQYSLAQTVTPGSQSPRATLELLGPSKITAQIHGTPETAATKTKIDEKTMSSVWCATHTDESCPCADLEAATVTPAWLQRLENNFVRSFERKTALSLEGKSVRVWPCCPHPALSPSISSNAVRLAITAVLASKNINNNNGAYDSLLNIVGTLPGTLRYNPAALVQPHAFVTKYSLFAQNRHHFTNITSSDAFLCDELTLFSNIPRWLLPPSDRALAPLPLRLPPDQATEYLECIRADTPERLKYQLGNLPASAKMDSLTAIERELQLLNSSVGSTQDMLQETSMQQQRIPLLDYTWLPLFLVGPAAQDVESAAVQLGGSSALKWTAPEYDQDPFKVTLTPLPSSQAMPSADCSTCGTFNSLGLQLVGLDEQPNRVRLQTSEHVKFLKDLSSVRMSALKLRGRSNTCVCHGCRPAAHSASNHIHPSLALITARNAWAAAVGTEQQLQGAQWPALEDSAEDSSRPAIHSSPTPSTPSTTANSTTTLADTRVFRLEGAFPSPMPAVAAPSTFFALLLASQGGPSLFFLHASPHLRGSPELVRPDSVAFSTLLGKLQLLHDPAMPFSISPIPQFALLLLRASHHVFTSPMHLLARIPLLVLELHAVCSTSAAESTARHILHLTNNNNNSNNNNHTHLSTASLKPPIRESMTPLVMPSSLYRQSHADINPALLFNSQQAQIQAQYPLWFVGFLAVYAGSHHALQTHAACYLAVHSSLALSVPETQSSHTPMSPAGRQSTLYRSTLARPLRTQINTNNPFSEPSFLLQTVLEAHKLLPFAVRRLCWLVNSTSLPLLAANYAYLRERANGSLVSRFPCLPYGELQGASARVLFPADALQLCVRSGAGVYGPQLLEAALAAAILVLPIGETQLLPVPAAVSSFRHSSECLTQDQGCICSHRIQGSPFSLHELAQGMQLALNFFTDSATQNLLPTTHPVHAFYVDEHDRLRVGKKNKKKRIEHFGFWANYACIAVNTALQHYQEHSLMPPTLSSSVSVPLDAHQDLELTSTGTPKNANRSISVTAGGLVVPPAHIGDDIVVKLAVVEELLGLPRPVCKVYVPLQRRKICVQNYRARMERAGVWTSHIPPDQIGVYPIAKDFQLELEITPSSLLPDIDIRNPALFKHFAMTALDLRLLRPASYAQGTMSSQDLQSDLTKTRGAHLHTQRSIVNTGVHAAFSRLHEKIAVARNDSLEEARSRERAWTAVKAVMSGDSAKHFQGELILGTTALAFSHEESKTLPKVMGKKSPADRSGVTTDQSTVMESVPAGAALLLCLSASEAKHARNLLLASAGALDTRQRLNSKRAAQVVQRELSGVLQQMQHPDSAYPVQPSRPLAHPAMRACGGACPCPCDAPCACPCTCQANDCVAVDLPGEPRWIWSVYARENNDNPELIQGFLPSTVLQVINKMPRVEQPQKYLGVAVDTLLPY